MEKNTPKSFGDEQSAFPTGQGYESGMTLRDYFAAKCLTVLVQAHIDHSIDDLDRETIAHECYVYADHMLKAREGK